MVDMSAAALARHAPQSVNGTQRTARWHAMLREPASLEPAHRAGVLKVLVEHRLRLRHTLPPEHRLAAIRPIDDDVEEWLIEGPSMPLAAPDTGPATVELVATVRYQEVSGHFSLDCCWAHAPDDSWTLGTWPTHAAFVSDWNKRAMIPDASNRATPSGVSG
jgi:hypothetical protein